ncbi:MULTISPECIES: IclR family transcriptional regulator [unclassified Streptomyces]|uniref:IclR family transcriptional regulator n=1 Tax=unclassified Streptomyces TaxID=2593676 RepID=UPI002E166BD4|nr:IclR family transcriptional regulator [Streptomyces sp. NBC_01197]WSR73101.1 IclR family transcriptional regulator [Streptomyces sp. NBC_01197]WSS47193.1 IclR family transcriptional regulator [Streptomyces sp. NBC_01180]WSS53369.1 IclR family transcriptional regulator [Streptomyces sp. NBC_01180]
MTARNSESDPAAPRDLVQSVVRALDIVDIVAESDTPLRAQVIAQRAGLHLATLSHLLSTLVYTGYLQRHEREYSLGGGKILSLSSRVEADWRPSRQAYDMLETVVSTTGETAYLSAWHDGDVTIVAIQEGSHSVRVADLRVGVSGDIHARASGKALLAYGMPAAVDRLGDADGKLSARTENTVTSREALVAELERTRERGYAIDEQEYVTGACGLAVPIFEGARWPQTALSITTPLHRYEDPEHRELYVKALRKVRELDASMG